MKNPSHRPGTSTLSEDLDEGMDRKRPVWKPTCGFSCLKRGSSACSFGHPPPERVAASFWNGTLTSLPLSSENLTSTPLKLTEFPLESSSTSSGLKSGCSESIVFTCSGFMQRTSLEFSASTSTRYSEPGDNSVRLGQYPYLSSHSEKMIVRRGIRVYQPCPIQ